MRTTCLLLLVFFAVTAAAAPAPVPGIGPIAGNGYIVVDFQSGQTIAEKNADERAEPASITKLMTAYITFAMIANGSVSLDERVNVSDKAYRSEGSRMFIEERIPVTVEELLQGVIVQSGNDASVALAEHVGGTEFTFVELMNQYAQRLGMTNTHYENSTGLPGEQHYSTPRDIARLAAALIRDFPQFYHWYAQREYTYNGIQQYNRNTLLWRDDSVDGLKTGHTRSAGYCLVASATRDGRRLISVVMGTDSEKERADATQKLLNHAFRHTETHALYRTGEAITTAQVWKGAQREIALGIRQDLFVTIPRGSYESLDAIMDLRSVIVAPIGPQDDLGQVRISLGDEVLSRATLYPLAPVATGGLFRRMVDEIKLWFE